MNQWLISVSLFVSAVATGCATAQRVFGDSPAPLYDDAVTRDSNNARAGESIDAARGILNDMPAERVKAIYLACLGEATQRPLGGGEAAFCSIVYDVLLTRHFGGDFHGLLAWSRQADVVDAGADYGPVAAR